MPRRSCKPRGGLAVIARPQSLEPILAALAGRFGKVEILPVHPRPDAPAIRIVVRAVRALAGRAVAAAAARRCTRQPAIGFSARADAINNGQASLFGD